MRNIISFLLLFLLNVGLFCGQEDWILLKYNLEITDSIEKADIKVKFLHDSTNYKVYQVVDINNPCACSESIGYLYTKSLNSKSGQLVLFYETSQIKSQGSFLNGLKNGMWTEYYQNKQIDSEVFYEKGKKNGICNWYFENGQVSSKETYLMDSLISVEMWDTTGNSIENPETVDRPAMFKSGDKYYIEFRNFISRNLKYPMEFAEASISGKVFVQFCIDKDGNLVNERVVKGIHELLDKEALRVIGLKRKWIPAIQHNRPKEAEFTIPIVFVLI